MYKGRRDIKVPDIAVMVGISCVMSQNSFPYSQFSVSSLGTIPEIPRRARQQQETPQRQQQQQQPPPDIYAWLSGITVPEASEIQGNIY